MTIMNASGFSFSGINISRIRAPGAVLENINFCRANLGGAYLKGALLKNAILDEAILLDADLTDVDFG